MCDTLQATDTATLLWLAIFALVIVLVAWSNSASGNSDWRN